MSPHNKNDSASPFFAPSTPRVLRPVSTPGGTFVRMEKKEMDEENKASVFGTSGNLVNAIVGAGIVGIPYALKETGLVAGAIMVIFCAILTDKSLRILIETAKYINVPSYEMLAEASFGTFGFYFISLSMFVMAYGAMISYLIIIKDTLPILLGVEISNLPLRRAILSVSSFAIVFPISSQRDMADLAKTSTISAIFDCIMVGIVATHAPISDTVYDMRSAKELLVTSFIHPKTFFVGIGVLSFAFVCQHSGFIIAGSLKKPTKKRWAKVTSSALTVCAILATCIGVAGYIGFGEMTDGNILNNFTSSEAKNVVNTARALLCTTMFFVYPMESFVARHVFIVLFFRGRRAHEGDDHSVLARMDRRIGLTLFLYLCALIPAVIFEDLGPVLAITGALGGSCLCYIGPGAVYLAIHGTAFLKLIDRGWPDFRDGAKKSVNDVEKVGNEEQHGNAKTPFNLFLWYACLMPFWCKICTFGEEQLKSFKVKEALKSPHLNRLGNVKRQKIMHRPKTHKAIDLDKENEILPLIRPPVRHGSFNTIHHTDGTESLVIPPYGATKGPSPKGVPDQKLVIPPYGVSFNNKRKAVVKEVSGLEKAKGKKEEKGNKLDAEDDEDFSPTWTDFVVGLSFITFGIIACGAGCFSIFTG